MSVTSSELGAPPLVRGFGGLASSTPQEVRRRFETTKGAELGNYVFPGIKEITKLIKNKVNKKMSKGLMAYHLTDSGESNTSKINIEFSNTSNSSGSGVFRKLF